MAASARPGRARRALALVALPWLLAACAAPAAPAAAPSAAPASASAPVPPLAASPEPTVAAPAHVVVGGLGGMIDRILWVGLAKGFYREQGLDLEYVGMTSMVQAAPHLAAGQMDVMSSSTSAGLWNAIGRDVSIKIVSDVTPMRAGRRTTLSVMVRSDLAPAIRGYSDLRGRTIAIHQKAQVNHV